MRVKCGKKDIKLKHNCMNIIAYKARQKIPESWHYIGEDRIYKKSMTHPR
jgi:hypothetical protein